MYELIQMKATQYPGILKTLLDSQEASIIKNTALLPTQIDDTFWGNDHSHNGCNALGRLWELTRSNFREELTQHGQRLV